MSTDQILAEIPFDHAVVLTSPTEVLATHGATEEVFRFASVTKILSSLACLIAVEQGYADLDEAAGPEGSTLRHLLAHASGVPFDKGASIGRVGAKRVYSNYGIELAAEHVELGTGMEFAEWVGVSVLQPLRLGSISFEGSPAHGASGNAQDLAALGRELLRPTLLSEQLHREATTVQFPGLTGVLPGYGRQKDNDWGLGLEIRDHKSPHWTGEENSARTYGHFGQSGSFLWADPERDLAAAFLGAENFGEVHKEHWPALNDALLAEHAQG